MKTLKASNSYTWLLQQIDPLQTALVQHRVYSQVRDLQDLKIFMETHIFAVWDFMTLVKALQRHLTCITLPWLPPTDIHSARLINDIVLCEETDEVAPGFYISHFDLYIAAMDEVGANTKPIRDFIYCLHKGLSPEQALVALPISISTRSFVCNTLDTAKGTISEVASAFLLGRETIIPAMFQRILGQLDQTYNISCESFRLYLRRHIHLDEETHAPMGQQLLQNVCGNDPVKWEQALTSARRALLARLQLWDGVINQLSY